VAEPAPSAPVPRIPVKLLSAGATLPRRAYENDAAWDLCSAADLILGPGQRATVPTGVAIGLPPGLAALTLPRSGLAARHGITIVNSPGLIDHGYRGEIKVILLNTDRDVEFPIARGDRIAQLLLLGVADAELVETAELETTERGSRGFGSSGTAGS
jgi:dUTP pyrophosphatase